MAGLNRNPHSGWSDDGKRREFLGLLTRFVVWFEILVGWVFSGLLVAVLSGLAKKDDA